MEAKEIADMKVLKRQRTFDFLGIERKPGKQGQATRNGQRDGCAVNCVGSQRMLKCGKRLD